MCFAVRCRSFKNRPSFRAWLQLQVGRIISLSRKPVALGALAVAWERDPSAVRRDIAVLERQRLVKTRKVSNPGHGSRTLVERVATSIELATTV